ncbi:hypothetical protein M2158_005482 [Streptomyces sp. SAI-144]|nr:hypothetical protein [Streptomyces sp. SAI-144]MDH6484323.1 hypothetical protein [Streptomyces sp. SAI-127]
MSTQLLNLIRSRPLEKDLTVAESPRVEVGA